MRYPIRSSFRIGPLLLLLVASCFSIAPKPSNREEMPERGYQPLGGMPVLVMNLQQGQSNAQAPAFAPNPPASELTRVNSRILASLPNESMRIAFGGQTGESGIAFAQMGITEKYKSYIIVLDYIKYHTKSLPLRIADDDQHATLARLPEDANAQTSDTSSGPSALRAGELAELPPNAFIPVYVGVGVRMTATFTSLESGINIGDLFGLAFAAKEGRIVGTLHVQTLGISGEAVSPLIPMPSEVSVSSVQGVLQALASIRSQMHGDQSKVTIAPCVVGFENLLGWPGSTQQILSALLVAPLTHDVAAFESVRD